ncbi:WS/DGAT domain-containing protein [Mycobacterium leprae]|uniref:WS/DGAT domain-containing protein n=1 Tax=Mycobacterium leprae TaxID=1769 RepID=UPI0039BF6366
MNSVAKKQFGYQRHPVAGLVVVCRVRVLEVVIRLYARTRLPESLLVHNSMVSNVFGPQLPLYMLGCEVKAMYPLGPIFLRCRS